MLSDEITRHLDVVGAKDFFFVGERWCLDDQTLCAARNRLAAIWMFVFAIPLWVSLRAKYPPKPQAVIAGSRMHHRVEECHSLHLN